ncbi:MmcQ/YjbR family DNA-binding protein [Rubrolithibacter danxiaensis]|uniref:MmcQ/YjbR family DNA-binding protein n=1 Tax=Rubrolithibacter danxiaensis TaxID=3390805 RepID=UPI003BF8425C
MSTEEFKFQAMSFAGTLTTPHLDRTAFKVEKKRIYATLHEPSETVNLKLSLIDQSVFCTFDKKAVYPVPNKWGLQGWTTFELRMVPEELMLDALRTAYKEVFIQVKGK